MKADQFVMNQTFIFIMTPFFLWIKILIIKIIEFMILKRTREGKIKKVTMFIDTKKKKKKVKMVKRECVLINLW